MLVCMDCFRVYNQKTIKYNECKQCGEEVVDIDELYIPSILLLNQKGYRTQYCCSGHLDKCLGAYIKFVKPYGFKYVPSGYDLEGDGDVIRLNFPKSKNWIGLDPILIGKIIYKSAIDVLEWAEKLPNQI